MITEEMRLDIRDDSYFWPMVQNVHDLIDIPCSVIKCLEGEYPTLLNLSKKLTDVYGDFIDKSYFLEEKSQSYVEDKYLERKDFISHPVHFAAHLLNPQLFDCPLVKGDKIEAVSFIGKFADNLELNSQQVITDLGKINRINIMNFYN